MLTFLRGVRYSFQLLDKKLKYMDINLFSFKIYVFTMSLGLYLEIRQKLRAPIYSIFALYLLYIRKKEKKKEEKRREKKSGLNHGLHLSKRIVKFPLAFPFLSCLAKLC